jgi:hypothetical protein
VDEDDPQAPSRQPHPDGLTSPTGGHRLIPSIIRSANDPPTELQRFAGELVTPFCRWAFIVYTSNNRPRPNHNYDPDIDNAICWSETIVCSAPFRLPSTRLIYY